ncbi:GGDEF domain-containing protein [Zavarzinia sp. CC-PAN008]|uniref:GGDEF domain-containing protein n=1 Tax=Zavarzinia sp. CC-PAN008 TaxID=3243332 RepID=UPI003F744F2F
MSFIEDKGRAEGYARQALELMRRRGIAPTPDNFWVWYLYASGHDHELVKVIDRLPDRPYDERICRELIERFGPGGRESVATRRASEALASTLDTTLSEITTVSAGMSAFGQVLDDAGTQLGQAPPSPELVARLTLETQTMQSTNQRLEAALAEATARIGQLQTDLHAIQREATTDALTGIFNRKEFEARLRDITHPRPREEAGFALLLLDIDRFKAFNDTWGHQMGDQILRLVAATMREAIGTGEFAARYGGEEFAVILPGADLVRAVARAEAIRNAVASRRIVKRASGETLGQITVSVGVTVYRDGEPLADVIARADASLYAAKRAGRNRTMAEVSVKPELQEVAIAH